MITIYAGLKNGRKFISLTPFEGSVGHDFESDFSPAKSSSWWVLDGETVRQPTQAEQDARAKTQAINELRNVRNYALSQVTVELSGGRIIDANVMEEQNISGRIRDMEALGETSTKWIQGEDIHVLTLAELKQVYEDGTRACAALFDQYIADVEAL